ncbi:MAG TPA: helix-turn-helix domain-containing protein [Bryobacteraceae bacterium]|nr:helix-turn-helix domain-containing protein [Bryobacteraceae bacterium]
MSTKVEDPSTEEGDKRAFRERLLAKMREKKITGAELARAAKLSKDAISTYTTLRSLPTPKTLNRLAHALGCKPQELLPDKEVARNLLELRDHQHKDLKVLVVKMTLPAEDAMEQFSSLWKLDKKFEKKLAALLGIPLNNE